MRAFVLDKYGRDQLLRECDVPMPKIGPDDVLVEIFAASVNPIDAKIRDGAFKLVLPYRLPFVMGNDLAGVVADVGSNVRRFSIGDEVYARPAKNRIGTFAQYIAISESDVALKPANISMAQAASIPLVGLTSWQALVERADLQRGQKVLIHAGSGGVGTFAIQLARHLGATVATTASSSSAAMLKELGADIVVDYRNEDFSEILKDYDVALNTLDDSVLGKTVKVLKPGGRLISISGPPDRQFAIDNKLSWPLQQVMRVLSYRIRSKAGRAGVSYSFLFMKPDGAQLGKITQLVESGIIRPVTDEIFPFEKTNEAIAYVDSGRAKGKVIIQMK